MFEDEKAVSFFYNPLSSLPLRLKPARNCSRRERRGDPRGRFPARPGRGPPAQLPVRARAAAACCSSAAAASTPQQRPRCRPLPPPPPPPWRPQDPHATVPGGGERRDTAEEARQIPEGRLGAQRPGGQHCGSPTPTLLAQPGCNRPRARRRRRCLRSYPRSAPAPGDYHWGAR